MYKHEACLVLIVHAEAKANTLFWKPVVLASNCVAGFIHRPGAIAYGRWTVCLLLIPVASIPIALIVHTWMFNRGYYMCHSITVY